MEFSIVIPVFNEAESLNELYRQIRQVAEEHSYDVFLVFRLVEDGNDD